MITVCMRSSTDSPPTELSPPSAAAVPGFGCYHLSITHSFIRLAPIGTIHSKKLKEEIIQNDMNGLTFVGFFISV